MGSIRFWVVRFMLRRVPDLTGRRFMERTAITISCFWRRDKGYGNLMKIVSKGFVEGYYYKPRVDMEVLREYHEGIIALSACLAGEVQRYLVRGMYEEAKEIAFRL